MIVKEVVDRTVQFFREKNLDSPRLDAELLIARALGFKRIDLYLKFDKPLAEDEVVRCREFVRRRSTGEPVAYILGEKDFYGLTFNVDSRVLVPRPETELLAEAAINFLKSKISSSALDLTATAEVSVETPDENQDHPEIEPISVATPIAEASESIQQEYLVLDLGCGSGCLGLSIAAQIPQAQVILVDLSEDALQVAQSNAARLGVGDRCRWIQADAGQVELGDWEFDVIVANPPYIAPDDQRTQPSVAKFEPSLALYAPEQGLAAISKWVRHVALNLKDHGLIGFEFGVDQGPRVKEIFESLGLSQTRTIQDLAGHPRHLVALKGQNNG